MSQGHCPECGTRKMRKIAEGVGARKASTRHIGSKNVKTYSVCPNGCEKEAESGAGGNVDMDSLHAIADKYFSD